MGGYISSFFGYGANQIPSYFDEKLLIPVDQISLDLDEDGNRMPVDSGSSGESFLATYRKKKVTIRIIRFFEGHGKCKKKNEEIEKDFQIEIENLQNFEHQNILKYIGYSLPKNEQIWTVFETTKYGNLHTYIKERKFETKELETFQKLKLCLDLSNAMTFLRVKNVFHGDINPNTILIDGCESQDKFNVAKICNFGLARNKYQGLSRFSQNQFLAPEISINKSKETKIDEYEKIEHTFESDMFSFSLVLYFIFKGSIPIDINRIDFDGIPLGVAKIIRSSCTSKLPEDRMTINQAMKWIIEDICDKEMSSKLISRLAMEYELINNKRIAMDIYVQACENCHVDAQVKLAEIYAKGADGFCKNEKYALGYFQRAHENYPNSTKDVVDVICELGVHFHIVERQYERAIDCYRIGASHGHGKSTVYLGSCYLDGIGVKKDELKAMELFKMAADNGEVDAYNQIGYMYQKGVGIERDYKKAIVFYRKGAKLGQKECLYNLGWMHQHGEGLDIDFKIAKRLYQRAAKMNHQLAHIRIAELFRQGSVEYGMERNEKEAKLWMEKHLKFSTGVHGY